MTSYPLRALAATLDRPAPGDIVPPLWHWLYFLPVVSLSELGADGHPKRGGFLPPVPLPRRMWAGGRLTFYVPLRMGERAQRESTVGEIDSKNGSSGRLVFVTVRHRYKVSGELRIDEEQDIVYRQAPQLGVSVPKSVVARSDNIWARTILPSPMMLFRYSALTLNGHRIHYDLPYATQQEGYPNLVVHAPLIATLLVDLLRRERPDATLATFSFRAVRPTFVGEMLTLCGKPSADGRTIELWAKDHEGYLTMQASAGLV